jgi:tRNA threonylcarbamoyl adenosine modification protein YeaZ
MDRILAIETSSPRLSLAAGTMEQVIKEYQGPLEWRHAETLFDGMQRLLAQARWPVQSLTGVIVSTGPGSFTGIRIGLAAGRALAQSLRIPIAGVSSLQTLAHGALRPGTSVCPVIDALRGEVFTALYAMDAKGNMRTLWKESRLPAAEVERTLKPLSRGPFRLIKEAHPKASVLLKIGAPQLRQAKNSSYEKVVPLYLRSAAAVERRASSNGRAAAVERRAGRGGRNA